MIKVHIPTVLQTLTKNQSEVELEATDVKNLIEVLEQKFPGTSARLLGEDGKIRRFINIFINEKDIRFLNGDASKLKEGDVISIVPAIAGGSC